MYDFLIRRFVVAGTQKHIDRLSPKVAIHVPPDLPLPSVFLLKKLSKTVSVINSLEDQFAALTDDQLQAKTEEFRARYQKAAGEVRSRLAAARQRQREGKSVDEREEAGNERVKLHEDLKKLNRTVLDEMLPEAFAVVREAGKRVLKMRHYDIQMVGGMVLHQGQIAEMATGEGKTLVSTLPAYLNALTGDGVHIVTVNDYLARRDRGWMGPIFEFLGLSVGVILHDMSPSERQRSYGCDISYGTNNEFGFDYLRDNMVSHRSEMVQREHHYAIVDEVDSILIDEARTPLIISGPAEEATDTYYTANEIGKRLKGRRVTEQEIIDAKYREEDLSVGYDYIADEKARSIAMTEQGEERAAQQFGIANLHDMDTIEYRHHLLQALKAKEFFRHDVDYVVRDGQVIIVDEFTGRMMPGRRWSDGLHQAVEAKEGIKIERENQTLATVTFQNYFRMYDKLSGMTGTAYTEATEFDQIYKLNCMVMPTNRPLLRQNYSDCVYRTAREKYAAVVAEIEEYHQRGQPVLVGTISIEKSELLSQMLKMRGIEHQVLNAKYHELEAQIVSQAGRHKAVTIATNMAGRGTDIVLGGNAEFLARSLAEKKVSEQENQEQQEDLTQKFLQQFKEQVEKEHKQVVDVGGLHVLATERHESRRIDNQLRGRSGRQGDPGSSRFYVSFEDDLMRLFASDKIMALMNRLGMEEGEVIEHPWVTKAIEVAQKRVEGFNFEIRKQLLEYDNVMNKQREAIYGLRRNIMECDNVKDYVLEAVEDVTYNLVEQYLFSSKDDEIAWDLDGMEIYLKAKFNYDIGPQLENFKEMDKDEIRARLYEGLCVAYERKEQEVSSEHMRRLEKILLLNTIDAKWKDHLYAMDQLKEGVGLRAYAQRDPLIEYKREGFVMFQMMYTSINREVAEIIYKVMPASGPAHAPKGVFDDLPQKYIHDDFSGYKSRPPQPQAPRPVGAAPDGAPTEPSRPQPIRNDEDKVGRNAPCPCGSGKKYKKCCGK